MVIWLIIIAAAVAVDQASKWLVICFLDREEPFVLIDGVLRFSYVENSGAAFGSFSDMRWIFIVISVIGIIAMLVYLWKFRPKSKWACTALSLVIGGGIGNMIDRLFYTGTLEKTIGENVVIDFIDFYAFPNLWKWVFNVADSFVCVGAGILIVWCFKAAIDEAKAEKAKKKLAAASSEADAPTEDGNKE